MDKVLVTRLIPERPLEFLRESGRVELHVSPHDRPLTPGELVEMSAGMRAVMTMLVDRIDEAYLSARPEVGIVANYAVGFDNIDLVAARKAGVVVTNTPDVLTDATAEQAMALMLAVMRRIGEGDRLIRAGRWHGVAPMFLLGTECQGKTLGVYGMGRIGRAVAQRAKAFGMNIAYSNRKRDQAAEVELGARYLDFDALLAESDVISINAPLTPETMGVFDLNAMKRMKKTAFLINTARGPLVNEGDLVRALEEGLIAGAGLDVYEKEPLVHEGLLDKENVVLAPHTGSATKETRAEIGMVAARNILAFLAGEEPPNRVG